jgi:hypothetical protein
MPKPAPQREILPEPIDIAGLAKRNGLTELQIMRSIRSAEKRGEAFSRIDSTLNGHPDGQRFSADPVTRCDRACRNFHVTRRSQRTISSTQWGWL